MRSASILGVIALVGMDLVLAGALALRVLEYPAACHTSVPNDNAIRTEAQEMASFEFGLACRADHSYEECHALWIHKDDPK